MIFDVLDDLPVSPSPDKGEVVQSGDAEHGVMDAVALEAAVAEDLTRKQPSEGSTDCPDRRTGE